MRNGFVNHDCSARVSEAAARDIHRMGCAAGESIWLPDELGNLCRDVEERRFSAELNNQCGL
jgi:hypothetical protein